jgi:hypothetical protein
MPRTTMTATPAIGATRWRMPVIVRSAPDLREWPRRVISLYQEQGRHVPGVSRHIAGTWTPGLTYPSFREASDGVGRCYAVASDVAAASPMTEPDLPTADLLRRQGLGTAHLDDYRTAWTTRCPQCGVPEGPCLNNRGRGQSRPHSARVGVARRATNSR